MSDDTRILPHDTEAERGCLGAACLELGLVTALMDVGLEEADFYDGHHGAIFQALRALHGRGDVHADGPVESALLRAELRRLGAAQVADELDLTVFYGEVPGLANAEHFARLVKNAAWRRAEIARRQREIIDLHDVTKPCADEAGVFAGSDGSPVLLPLAEVEPEAVAWLWPGRVPAGKLTVLTGDPGLGKSFLTLDMAARVTRGMAWPDDEDARPEPGNVVILSAEDDPADTIRPRLDAAGADVGRVTVFKGVRHGGGERLFSLRSDLAALRAGIKKVGGVRLVVIDPLTAYLDGTDSHKNADVRGLLAPLGALAADCGAAVIAVSHLSKNAAGAAIYRTLGSLAFVAAARAVWAVARDRDNPDRRLLLPIKQNLAPDCGGLAFSIANGPDGPVVAWEDGAVTTGIDEALAQPAGGGGDGGETEAADFLRDVLAAGPVPATDVLRQAREAGIAERTLKRAKARLCVASTRAGFGPSASWAWTLTGGGEAA